MIEKDLKKTRLWPRTFQYYFRIFIEKHFFYCQQKALDFYIEK